MKDESFPCFHLHPSSFIVAELAGLERLSYTSRPGDSREGARPGIFARQLNRPRLVAVTEQGGKKATLVAKIHQSA
jgi:hypothetical protein